MSNLFSDIIGASAFVAKEVAKGALEAAVTIPAAVVKGVVSSGLDAAKATGKVIDKHL